MRFVALQRQAPVHEQRVRGRGPADAAPRPRSAPRGDGRSPSSRDTTSLTSPRLLELGGAEGRGSAPEGWEMKAQGATVGTA